MFPSNHNLKAYDFKRVLFSLYSIMTNSTSEGKSIDQSTQGLNYKILGIIGGLIIAYQIGLFLTADAPGYNITDTTYLIPLGLVAVFGIIVAKRYRGSDMLGKAYFLLGIGFISLLIGDLGFYYNTYILEIDPYPSLFDIAFLCAYVFISLSLAMNARYFQPKWKSNVKLMLIAFPVVITSIYAFTAYAEWGEYDELPFDIFWGSMFAIGSSTTVGFAVLGASIFRRSVLKEVWLSLVTGIFLNAIADVWYYYLETFEAYYSSHVVNTMWVASFLIIIYALIMHRKVI